MVDAAGICGLADADVLGDEGASLTIRTSGEERSSAHNIADVACLLSELDTPDHVIAHMDTTRALDGMQTDQWAEVAARWSYHPDSGMNLTLVHVPVEESTDG